MRKTMIAIAMMATIGVTSFMACNKKSIETEQATSPGSSKVSKMGGETATDAAANSANPYDNIGYQHNMAIQATRATWTDPTATSSDDYNALVTYCISIGSPVTVSFADVSELVERENADQTPGKTNYVSTIGLSPAGMNYATHLFMLAGQMESYTSYEEFKGAVIQIENAILSDGQLNNDERQRLLTGASVERHSVLYWAREEAGLNVDPGNGTTVNPNAPIPQALFAGIRHWLQNHPIFTADLCGGIGGAAGGVAGAALGAASASLLKWALGD